MYVHGLKTLVQMLCLIKAHKKGKKLKQGENLLRRLLKINQLRYLNELLTLNFI